MHAGGEVCHPITVVALSEPAMKRRHFMASRYVCKGKGAKKLQNKHDSYMPQGRCFADSVICIGAKYFMCE